MSLSPDAIAAMLRGEQDLPVPVLAEPTPAKAVSDNSELKEVEARESTQDNAGIGPDQISSSDSRVRDVRAPDSRGGQNSLPQAPPRAPPQPKPGSTSTGRMISRAQGSRAPRATSALIQSTPQIAEATQIELAVLASLYTQPRHAFPLFAERGRGDFFFSPTHRQFFALLCDHYDAHGDIDPSAFVQQAMDMGHLQKVGGPAFLSDLLNAISPLSAFTYHLDILRDKYVARELSRLSSSLPSKLTGATDETLWATIAEHERAIADLGKLASDRLGRLPSLSDMSDLLNGSKPPRPAELVKGILHQGSKLIVGGTSKGRKTFSLIDLGLSVATGTQWWGFETIKGPVCYINFEIQESFFCERTEDICRVKKIVLEHDMFMGWNLRGHSEGIENLVEEIVTKLLTRHFVLVIVDPIYKALGDRDENKAGDVASLCNQLERVAVKTGAAIAFGAHYSKGNQALKESIDRIGGSGVFARDPDSILTMTAHEEPDAFTVDCTLRNFKPIEPFVLRWDWPLFIRTDLDPEALKQPRKTGGEYSSKYSKDALLDELSVLDGIRPGKLLKRLSELEGISRAQFYRLAKSLRSDGRLTEKDGLWFKSSSTPKHI